MLVHQLDSNSAWFAGMWDADGSVIVDCGVSVNSRCNVSVLLV